MASTTEDSTQPRRRQRKETLADRVGAIMTGDKDFRLGVRAPREQEEGLTPNFLDQTLEFISSGLGKQHEATEGERATDLSSRARLALKQESKERENAEKAKRAKERKPMVLHGEDESALDDAYVEDREEDETDLDSLSEEGWNAYLGLEDDEEEIA
jgi:hypothetical protein